MYMPDKAGQTNTTKTRLSLIVTKELTSQVCGCRQYAINCLVLPQHIFVSELGLPISWLCSQDQPLIHTPVHKILEREYHVHAVFF